MPEAYPTSDSDAVTAMICRIVGGDRYDYCCARAGLGAPSPHGLTDNERLAIWIYSSAADRWYERINRELRGLNPSRDVQFFAQLLNEALDKIPSYKGLVFRGMSVPDLETHIDDYEIGRIFQWTAFTSSSMDPNKAFAGNVFFIMNSKDGRCLGDYADQPSQAEVLFRTNSGFEVVAAERHGDFLVVEVTETTQ